MNDFDIERLKQHNDVLKEIIIFDDVKPHLKINHVFSSDMLEHFDVSINVLSSNLVLF